MATKIKIAVLGLAVLGLSACEGTDFERATIGAAGTAGAAYALGGSRQDIATAAVVGGAAGATCDDITPQYCR